MKYGKSKVLIFEIISRPAELIKYILSYYGCVDRFMQFTDACATSSRKLKLGNVLNYICSFNEKHVHIPRSVPNEASKLRGRSSLHTYRDTVAFISYGKTEK